MLVYAMTHWQQYVAFIPVTNFLCTRFFARCTASCCSPVTDGRRTRNGGVPHEIQQLSHNSGVVRCMQCPLRCFIWSRAVDIRRERYRAVAPLRFVAEAELHACSRRLLWLLSLISMWKPQRLTLTNLKHDIHPPIRQIHAMHINPPAPHRQAQGHRGCGAGTPLDRRCACVAACKLLWAVVSGAPLGSMRSAYEICV